MTRVGVMAVLAFGLAFSVNAQTSSRNSSAKQPGASATANASAGASANVASQNQNTSANQRPSRSASISGDSGASASASAGKQSVGLKNGSRLNATLLTALDAKHSKPGERVVAKTTQNVKQNGRVVVKKGTRLVGHVTEASARSKNHAESTLGVVFDRAILHNGQEVPLHLSIQALAESATAASANLGDDEAGLASAGDAGFDGGGGAAVPAGGLVRGAGGLAGGAANSAGAFAQNTGAMANSAAGATSRSATSAVAGTRGATGGLNAEGALESNSSGVFGLNGLNLNSAASNSSDASVVTSTTRNVHLASGTQMVLQVVR
jgi:hypothetical protein